MKNLCIIYVLSAVVAATGCSSTTASAQTSEQNQIAQNTTGAEAELNIELAPLEIVELPEPTLSSGEHGERQTFLAQGAPAPWAGILLSPEAIAFIISQYETQRELATIVLNRQRASDWNRLQLEVGRLQLRLETQERQHQIVIQGLDREINRLIQIHEEYVDEQTGGFWNSDFGQILQYGLVIVGSAAVGLIVGYFAGSL